MFTSELFGEQLLLKFKSCSLYFLTALNSKICAYFGSRTITPEENCPPTLKLTLTLNQTLTPTGEQFSSLAILRIPLALACFSIVLAFFQT